jgi:hypothetical protein
MDLKEIKDIDLSKLEVINSIKTDLQEKESVQNTFIHIVVERGIIIENNKGEYRNVREVFIDELMCDDENEINKLLKKIKEVFNG